MNRSNVMEVQYHCPRYDHSTVGLWFMQFKGCGMGTLSVLVSPSFRENVVVT